MGLVSTYIDKNNNQMMGVRAGVLTYTDSITNHPFM